MAQRSGTDSGFGTSVVIKGTEPVGKVGDGEAVFTHDVGRAGDVRELGV